jgi:hypothetical protein
MGNESFALPLQRWVMDGSPYLLHLLHHNGITEWKNRKESTLLRPVFSTGKIIQEFQVPPPLFIEMQTDKTSSAFLPSNPPVN